MNLVMMIMIAVALAMDAFAVSVASGVVIKTNRIRKALLIAASFGFFQFFMPLLGWLAGVYCKKFAIINIIDHWIAFVLLSVVGVKMIYEAFKIEEIEQKTDPTNIYVLFVLSVATSIDALAAGLSFAVLDMSIMAPVLIIGGVTFILSFLGVIAGMRLGHFVESKIEAAGGVILVLIGLKILFGHLLG